MRPASGHRFRLTAACLLGLALALPAGQSAWADSRPPLPAMGPSLRKMVAFPTAEKIGT
ncbi:L,D-transpeptidase, partial [Mesorhizobium sp. M8A.F.Ca.ET.023.01.1.1]